MVMVMVMAMAMVMVMVMMVDGNAEELMLEFSKCRFIQRTYDVVRRVLTREYIYIIKELPERGTRTTVVSTRTDCLFQ
jgi:hypothetical protein